MYKCNPKVIVPTVPTAEIIANFTDSFCLSGTIMSYNCTCPPGDNINIPNICQSGNLNINNILPTEVWFAINAQGFATRTFNFNSASGGFQATVVPSTAGSLCVLSGVNFSNNYQCSITSSNPNYTPIYYGGNLSGQMWYES